MKKMTIKKDDVLLLTIVLLICVDLFSFKLTYLDEIIELFSMTIILLYSKGKKYEHMLIYLILFFLVGLISLFVSGHKRSIMLVIEDYLSLVKFPICLMGMQWFLEKKTKKYRRLLKRMYCISASITLMAFIDCAVKYNTTSERVLALNSGYAGIMGLYAFLFIVVVYSYMTYILRKRTAFNIFLIVLNVVIIIMTETSSALAFTACYFLFVLKDYVKKYYKMLLFLTIPVVGYLVYNAISWKIVGYFFTSSAPRFKLYKEAWNALIDRLPLGYGFSLFGSATAARYYSPVYKTIGWDKIWEMREGSPFLIDAFYPALMGETGLLGVFLYIFIIAGSAYKMLVNIKGKLVVGMPQLLIGIVFLSGITSNFINSNFGIVACFIICINCCFENNELQTEKRRRDQT